MVNQRSLVDHGMVNLGQQGRLQQTGVTVSTDGGVVDGRVVHCVVDWAVQGRVADTQVTLQPLLIIVRSIVHLLKHTGSMDE